MIKRGQTLFSRIAALRLPDSGDDRGLLHGRRH